MPGLCPPQARRPAERPASCPSPPGTAGQRLSQKANARRLKVWEHAAPRPQGSPASASTGSEVPQRPGAAWPPHRDPGPSAQPGRHGKGKELEEATEPGPGPHGHCPAGSPTLPGTGREDSPRASRGARASGYTYRHRAGDSAHTEPLTNGCERGSPTMWLRKRVREVELGARVTQLPRGLAPGLAPSLPCQPSCHHC